MYVYCIVLYFWFCPFCSYVCVLYCVVFLFLSLLFLVCVLYCVTFLFLSLLFLRMCIVLCCISVFVPFVPTYVYCIVLYFCFCPFCSYVCVLYCVVFLFLCWLYNWHLCCRASTLTHTELHYYYYYYYLRLGDPNPWAPTRLEVCCGLIYVTVLLVTEYAVSSSFWKKIYLSVSLFYMRLSAKCANIGHLVCIGKSEVVRTLNEATCYGEGLWERSIRIVNTGTAETWAMSFLFWQHCFKQKGLRRMRDGPSSRYGPYR
jgi:hypothetical protein